MQPDLFDTPEKPKKETKVKKALKKTVKKVAKKQEAKVEPLTPPLAEEEKIYSVSEISNSIKKTLEGQFPSIWVEGELGKVTDHQSGHIYMTLKEGQSSLDANLWKQKRGILNFELATGMQVLVKGRISSYAPYGKYNLIVEKIEPAGLGVLQLQLEQLKQKLQAKGYFDEGNKKELPDFPKTIGVVTSPTGAAFKDIARILKRRDPGIRIVLAPVMVEGAQAKDGVAQAIDDFNTYGNVDLLIVGRGGGSPESLWAFNEEVVAEAIHRSRLPIISAVGHEIDFTVADMVADLRASTPSAAAELAVKVRSDILYTVSLFSKRMIVSLKSSLSESRNRLNDLIDRPIFSDPSRFLENDRQRVDESMMRIINAVKRNNAEIKNKITSLGRHLKLLRPDNLIKRKKENVTNLSRQMFALMQSLTGDKRGKLATVSGKLDMLSPLKVLHRGYSIAMNKDGAVIKDESQVKKGDSLEVRLDKGMLDCEVKGKRST